MLDKTFDPKSIERKHYQKWEDSGLFSAHPERENVARFCIMMPPPNVTGSLHMGHALNTTIQDILTRYHRMKGDDTLWQPGTDHAGIATQMVVERKLDKEGLKRRDMGREAFLERVWEWKAESGGTIVNQMRALGATPDWPRERFTMDEGLSRAVLKVFVQLYKEGLIYRDKRLVNWDTKLLTAISDLEVEQKEQKGHMWHIRYPIEGAQEEYITVATTRPETLLGDTAVAVHPDDERYKHFIGKSVSLPLSDRLIPIIADEYADSEQGSGAVKITPAHDFNDFEVGKRHDLPMISILDIHGHLNENAPENYRGLDRFDARKKILAELDEMDLLEKVDNIKHSVPYGDRSGTIIEPFLTDQWYVDTPTLAEPALEVVRSGKMKFYPKQYENMYFDWLENQQPWCISRQLWWGHQIPVWYGPEGSIFVEEDEMAAYAAARAQFGDDVTLKRDEDVLDTWFSSALWPFSTLGWPEETPELKRYYPTSVLVTGFDIITFWVSRMVMMGLHFMDGQVPFDTVYIHALVRDASGQKMSKSKGNVMDPLDLIEQYGTDALRFTLCALAAPGRDIRLAEQRLQGYRNFATKIWNAARYCEMNDCLLKGDIDPSSFAYAPNKWIVAELVSAVEQTSKAIEEFRFHDAASTVYQFVWGTFCDWYLEFTKPVLQEGSEYAPEVKACTGWMLDQILLLLNPFMPYITEELYAQIAPRDADDLLLGASWPLYAPELKSESAQKEMNWVKRLISEVRSVRADMNVPAGAKIDLILKGANAESAARLSRYEEIIKRMARLEHLSVSDTIPKGSIQSVLDEATIALPIADIIDLDAERSRLRKEIDKLKGDLAKIDAQLGNAQFVANAPEDIVEEKKELKSEALSALDKLSFALKQLDEAA